MEEEKEEWKDVVGYEGLYEVSSFGRVKSLTRMVHVGRGSYYSREEIIINTIPRNENSYVSIGLHKDGKSKTIRVHLAVAIAFFGHKPSRKYAVHHVDGIKCNNKLSNLRIVTARENVSIDMIKINKSSKSTGVNKIRKSGKYRTMIRFNKNRYYLGNFDSEMDAKNVYDTALDNINNGNFSKWYLSLGLRVNKSQQSLNIV